MKNKCIHVGYQKKGTKSIRKGKKLQGVFLEKVKVIKGTSPVVQWLRLCTPNAADLGSIPGWGARSNSLHAATKIEDPMCLNQDPEQPN